MTEDEAKTKWCPHKRIVFGGDNGSTFTFNAFVCNPDDKEAAGVVKVMDKLNAAKCIASDCMMWSQDRTYWLINNKEATRADYEKYRTPEEAGAVTVIDGHCGLVRS